MENLDLREILKNVPRGTKLYSPLFGECSLYDVNSKIELLDSKNNKVWFYYNGKYNQTYDGECLLFPSKENRDWSKFFAKPFQNGDVISSSAGDIAIFSRYSSTNAIVYHCVMTNNKIKITQDVGIGSHYNCRLASHREKEILYNKLQKEGFFWNDETKSLEEYKFKKGDTIQNKTTKVVLTIYDIERNKYKTRKNLPCYIFAENQNQYELCQEKFDITTMKPFDKVLARHDDYSIWQPQLLSYLDIHKEHHCYKFVIVGFGAISQCIPCEGNEYLVGTKWECNEYYKTWE